MQTNIAIPQDKIAGFCRKHHIRKLSLFGSVLGDNFSSESDVDVLVEFEPDHIPGLVTFGGMQMELQELLGRSVDLKTPNSLSRYFRQEVLEMAEPQYEQR